ncbi:class I SAM-dependent methyltransferase [Patescibacteria group bacterium]|nr:MAG: class I SAM-dependent methyltransferase [Patescibacteria group bacterium]
MDFTDTNKKTIQVYEENIDKFVDKTASTCNNMPREWIDLALKMMPVNQKILELGSATGRDAVYIKDLGYDIRCTDIVDGFLKILKERGLSPDKLNAITDDIGGSYGMVLANCVFLHFNNEELHSVLKKTHETLTSRGVLACSFMLGQGEMWRNHKVAGRYFHLWQPEEIMAVLRQHGFKTEYMRAGDLPSYADKFYIIATKIPTEKSV